MSDKMNFRKITEVDVIDELPETGHVLGVDDEGKVKRVPKGTMGKVKTVNGEEPDENGDVKIEIPECKVKTVNGNSSDENGNVTVEIPNCDWNTMDNKPFGESLEQFGVIPFDWGNNLNSEDLYIIVNNLDNITHIIIENTETGEKTEVKARFGTYKDMNVDTDCMYGGNISYKSAFVDAGFTGESSNVLIYFKFKRSSFNNSIENIVAFLVIDGANVSDEIYNFIIVNKSITTLDEKYIPNSVKGGSAPALFRVECKWVDEELQENYTCNKTFEECVEDYQNGIIPSFVYVDDETQSIKSYTLVSNVTVNENEETGNISAIAYGIVGALVPGAYLYGWVTYYSDGSISYIFSDGE